VVAWVVSFGSGDLIEGVSKWSPIRRWSY